MTPFPLPLSDIFGHWGAYVVYLVIGFAFGYVLEIAGFGNSLKLARQFYFKEMTVLKVMFTAIVVAMVLIFLSTAFGILDYNLIWVNPTYLWPGIVGGLIMGAGFIIGGFCPGTSLVAAATFKLDGVVFVLGVFFGIFLFGETVGSFEEFWYSSYMGRFTLMDLFNTSTGVIVLGVVIMALFMFWGSEHLERIFGGFDMKQAPRWRYGAASTLMLGAVALVFIGQPTTADRWDTIAAEKELQLENREVQIHPGEVLGLIHDDKIRVKLLDVRSETDYNMFHLLDATHAPLSAIPDMIDELHAESAPTVFVLMSNDESAATEAWKILVAESVPNAYILEGGINNWIATFESDNFGATHADNTTDDMLDYAFTRALGATPVAMARPHLNTVELEYESKVKLETKRAPSGGGCG